MSKAYGMNFPTTEGMKLAQDWCPSRAVLASDSVTLVALLQMQGGPCSRLKFIVNEAKLAGEGLPEWTVVHTKRESNWVAHELAQLGKRTRIRPLGGSRPQPMSSNIAQDCINISEQ